MEEFMRCWRGRMREVLEVAGFGGMKQVLGTMRVVERFCLKMFSLADYCFQRFLKLLYGRRAQE
jgi:hypothetical protein